MPITYWGGVKMEENIPYIGTINHVIVSSSVDPIIKEVTPYLRVGPERTTVRDLMDYLLKDENFSEDDKNIATIIRRDIQKVSENPSRSYLGIQLIDNEGNTRTLPSEADRGSNFLLETALATPLFERASKEGREYMGLNIVVAGPKGGGQAQKYILLQTT